MNGKRIWVTGSANMDVVISVDSVPSSGESVVIKSQSLVPGGKGANRAVALARLGCNPVFSCCLGDDASGSSLAALYRLEGMDMSEITVVEGCGNGTAYIFLEKDGSNRIAVFPGANDMFGENKVSSFVKNIVSVSLLCTELEIPVASVERLIYEAVKNDVPVIVDAAPVKPDIELSMFMGAFILSPNESEAEALTGIEIDSGKAAREACRILYDCGVKYVIIKLGKKGSICFDGHGFFECPAFEMAGKAVDTTAAGDSYMAGLCKAVRDGMDIEMAMRFASVAAGIAVTRFGAVPSLPRLAEVEEMIKRYPKEAGVNL